jgi:hypothetical protein
MCGTANEEAYKILTELEKLTQPHGIMQQPRSDV